ncbi:MAG: hypothetical protein JSW55_14935 [Chloroflexota bacterium]|nr:MAG: hypothetical protein JSW55_14935 [Chloroflexota bacterium]
MKHPLISIPKNNRLAIFLLFLALTLSTMLALSVTGRPLMTGAAPSGIISYEFAGDVVTATLIIDSWDAAAQTYAGINLGLDYLYLVLYSTTIAMVVLWLTDGLAQARFIIIIAVALAWGQWLAAALDATENLALFAMLVNQPAEPWPQIARWCAAIKFSLVIAGLLYTVVALVARIITLLKR